MAPFNRDAWEGRKPLVEHTPDRDTVGPLPAAGDYVIPKVGASGDGITRPAGRGVVWQITEWRDPHTGEVDALLHVADCDLNQPRGKQLAFDEIRLQDVGDRVRCGRLDAAGLVVLAARAIGDHGRYTPERIKTVLDLAWRLVREPRPTVDAPSLLGDEVLDGELAARLDESTAAHRARKAAG